MQSRTSNQPANFASTPLEAAPRLESSCRLHFRAAANFECRISSRRHRNSAPPNFKSSGKLLVDDLSDCSQLRIGSPYAAEDSRSQDSPVGMSGPSALR